MGNPVVTGSIGGPTIQSVTESVMAAVYAGNEGQLTQLLRTHLPRLIKDEIEKVRNAAFTMWRDPMVRRKLDLNKVFESVMTDLVGNQAIAA